MLRVFPITLTGATKRWVDRLPLGTVNSWDLLKKAFIQRYCPPSKTAKQLEEIRNFKQEGDKTLYQAWEWYNDILYRFPTHDINNHHKVNIFYNGLGALNRQLLDSQGPVPGMKPVQALMMIQTMADHSQKWHDGSSSRNIEINSNSEGIAAIVNKLENLGRDIKKLKENVHAIQVGCQTCEGAHLDKTVLLTRKLREWKKLNMENLVDLSQTTGMAEAVAALEATLKKKIEEPKKEALVHQTMESLMKIKINRPLLKEIRQTDNYAKQMKYLVENKPKDPGSFILPCFIGKLDFKNALADLGANISIMPFSMYKRLGIEKLEPINMLIEMADNTKCALKGIVENLLIKIDKFIFPVDFVILDMVEDIRMPIILGRPLLAIAHAQVDIFRKTISLEVGSEKVIFKMRSSFTTTNFEYVRSIKSKTFVEDNKLKEIDYDLFLYDSESYLEECGEDKANTMLGVIHDKLNNDWFNNTSEDEDDLEGILDYLKPRSYDGFIDLDDEAYNKRRCRLLGMTYEEPTPILIEKAEVTRYIVGLGETYTKVKVLGVEMIPRTRDNVAAMRAKLMKKWPKKEITKQRRRASRV
ncbi:zinc knuckle CX2CX4HX4C containing protein [Tanacetum coccineum]